MMIRRIILFILIADLLTKKYLIETADKEGDEGRDDGGEEVGEEGGSDYSFLQNVKMEQSGDEDVAQSRGSRRGRGNIKKYMGDSMTLSCKIKRRVERCEFRSPTGEVFKISKDATFQDGRIQSLNEIFPSAGCGIIISKLNRNDEGEWSCNLKLPNYNKIATAELTVKVHQKPGLSGDVKRNTEIGMIPSWGPQFRVSFDLKINSKVSGNRRGWTSVLSFKGNGGKKDYGNHGDRIPSIFMNKNGRLNFRSSVSGNPNYTYKLNSVVQLKKWLRVIVEQNSLNGSVVFTVTIDGKKVGSVKNKNPRTFQDVRVFAGDKFYPAADASYRNLLWENLPSST